MSGLDRVKMPDNRRWVFSVVAAVVFIMAMMLSASWWVPGPVSSLLIAALVSLMVAVAAGAVASRLGRRRKT